MKILISIVFMIFLSCAYSCNSSGYLASEFGDEAEILMKENRNLKCELLFVTDTMLYILKDKNILAVSNRNIKEINFKKYAEDYSWVFGVAMLEVLPSVIFSYIGSGSGADFGKIFAITIIPAVITSTLFTFSSAKSSFYNLKDDPNIFELKKFSRYPGGITERQMQNLLTFYGQDSCIYLKQK